MQRGSRVLLRRRNAGLRRMADFWELPSAEEFPKLSDMNLLGRFQHTIVNQRYFITVYHSFSRLGAHAEGHEVDETGMLQGRPDYHGDAKSYQFVAKSLNFAKALNRFASRCNL